MCKYVDLTFETDQINSGTWFFGGWEWHWHYLKFIHGCPLCYNEGEVKPKLDVFACRGRKDRNFRFFWRRHKWITPKSIQLFWNEVHFVLVSKPLTCLNSILHVASNESMFYCFTLVYLSPPSSSQPIPIRYISGLYLNDLPVFLFLTNDDDKKTRK